MLYQIAVFAEAAGRKQRREALNRLPKLKGSKKIEEEEVFSVSD